MTATIASIAIEVGLDPDVVTREMTFAAFAAYVATVRGLRDTERRMKIVATRMRPRRQP